MACPIIIRRHEGLQSYLVLDDNPRELLRHVGFADQFSVRPWQGSLDPQDALEESGRNAGGRPDATSHRCRPWITAWNAPVGTPARCGLRDSVLSRRAYNRVPFSLPEPWKKSPLTPLFQRGELKIPLKALKRGIRGICNRVMQA